MKKINSLLSIGYTSLNSLPLQGKEAAKGFTLVELIVVITILAILGTIAFISLQGYSKDARDSVRISDISKIKTSLELFQLDAGKYPETTDATNITYSGAIAWTQGTFGEATFGNVSRLDKIPTDPVTDRKYVYSVTNTKQEYQVAGVIEGDEVTGLFNQTNAAGKTAMLKISGNYNGKVLKVSTGTIDYVLAVPSIITSSGFTLEQIVASKFLAYNGYKNLPAQYAGSSYDILGDNGINFVNSADLVVFSGDIKDLSDRTSIGVSARADLMTKLKSAYSGTTITTVGEIAQIVNTDTEDTTATEFLGATIVSNNLGGSITASIPRVNACATQPEYTGAIYEIGVATEPDQAWQSSDENAPCYWTCGVGKTLLGNDCVSENCSGVDPNSINAFSNAISTVGGAWNYNTTAGLCTYECATNYTWNGLDACTDQTPPIGGSFTIPTNTTTTNISLSITCPADIAGSEPIEVAYGNSANPINWVVCNTGNYSHVLTSGDGSKIVYLRFRDSEGNITGDIAKDITLASLPRLTFDINTKNLNQGNIIANKYLWVTYHQNKCMFQCTYCDWCNGGAGSWACSFNSGRGSGCPSIIGNPGEFDVDYNNYISGTYYTYRCYNGKVQGNNGAGWVTQNLSSTSLSMDCFSEN